MYLWPFAEPVNTNRTKEKAKSLSRTRPWFCRWSTDIFNRHRTFLRHRWLKSRLPNTSFERERPSPQERRVRSRFILHWRHAREGYAFLNVIVRLFLIDRSCQSIGTMIGAEDTWFLHGFGSARNYSRRKWETSVNHCNFTVNGRFQDLFPRILLICAMFYRPSAFLFITDRTIQKTASRNIRVRSFPMTVFVRWRLPSRFWEFF